MRIEVTVPLTDEQRETIVAKLAEDLQAAANLREEKASVMADFNETIKTVQARLDENARTLCRNGWLREVEAHEVAIPNTDDVALVRNDTGEVVNLRKARKNEQFELLEGKPLKEFEKAVAAYRKAHEEADKK